MAAVGGSGACREGHEGGARHGRLEAAATAAGWDLPGRHDGEDRGQGGTFYGRQEEAWVWIDPRWGEERSTRAYRRRRKKAVSHAAVSSPAAVLFRRARRSGK